MTDVNWEVHGERGRLIVPTQAEPTKRIQRDPSRQWVFEPATDDKNIRWLGLPRMLGTAMVPIFYIRDKAADELAVHAEQVEMLGDRDAWEYQSLAVPGAGELKVNLANGNLHYRMVDADFPARTWNDTIARAYDSQSNGETMLGPGWSGGFAPGLQIIDPAQRVDYWAGDGTRFVFTWSPTESKWKGEPGMNSELFGPTPSPGPNKTWRLKDVHGSTLFFDNTAIFPRPTLKQDHDPPGNSTWTWAYPSATQTTITGSTGRVQTLTVDTTGPKPRVTKVRLANPAPNQVFAYEYDYEYTGQKLTAVTLVSNSSEFGPSNRVRIGYGYDSHGRLNRITTPEGSVYGIGYDAQGRVEYVDLPDAQTGALSTCGQAHCWRFGYAAGEAKTSVTDPRGKTTSVKAYGSGAVYEMTDALGKSTTRTWTANRNLASETDRLGHVTKYEYDTKGNRLKEIDAEGGVTTYGYNDIGRRTSKVDARANTMADPKPATTYTYYPAGHAAAGDLQFERDPENGEVEHKYEDAAGNLTTVRTKVSDSPLRHNVRTMTYDANGLLLTEEHTQAPLPTGWVATKTTYARDPWGRVKGIRAGLATGPSAQDQYTAQTYDDLGRLKQTRVWMGGVADPTIEDHPGDLRASKTYDRDGNVKTVTDPKGGTTTLTSDRRGRVVAADLPPGNNGTDESDRPCTATKYDQRGNPVETQRAIQRVAGAPCAADGAAISWSVVRREFDDRSLITAEKLVNLAAGEYAGGEIVKTTEYDAEGRATKIVDPDGNYEVISYDKLDRRTAIEEAVTLTGLSGPGCHGIAGAFCAARKWVYDEVGNVKAEIAPRGADATQQETRRIYTYDLVGRPKTRTNELGKTWTFEHDKVGNRLGETEPPPDAQTAAAVTRWEYEPLKRLIKETDPLTNVTEHKYDLHGNRVETKDAKNQVTKYEWDKADRLAAVVDARNKRSMFEYDPNGNRTKLTNPRDATRSSTQTIAYDALNRPVSTTTPPAMTTAADVAPRTATARYELDGLARAETDFNGVTKTLSYDSARRLKLVDYSDATPDVGYAYSKAGKPTRMTEGGALAATYTYDELDRLLTEARGASTLTYKYDRRDNTEVAYPDGKAVAYGYDDATRLVQVDDWRGPTAGRTTIEYDALDRRTKRTLPNGAVTTWAYDKADRLTKVQHKPSAAGAVFASSEYEYDPVHNRTKQKDYVAARSPSEPTAPPSGTPAAMPDSRPGPAPGGTAPAAMPDSRPGPTPGTTAPAAMPSRAVSSAQAATTWLFFEYDEVDRLKKADRKLTGGAADPAFSTTTYAYDDAGNRTNETADGIATSYEYDDDNRLKQLIKGGVADSDFGYAGEQEDEETGLVNLRTRYYDPTLGRFLTRDGFGGLQALPQSWNRYTYAENDPVNSTDPDGHKKKQAKKGKDSKKEQAKDRKREQQKKATGADRHGGRPGRLLPRLEAERRAPAVATHGHPRRRGASSEAAERQRGPVVGDAGGQGDAATGPVLKACAPSLVARPSARRRRVAGRWRRWRAGVVHLMRRGRTRR